MTERVKTQNQGKVTPGRVTMAGGTAPALQQAREVIKQFIEGALNRERPGRLEQLFDNNAFMEHPLRRERIKGAVAIQKLIDEFHQAFPDFHARIIKVVGEGDDVAFFLECQGTHKGDFHGIKATNKQMRWTAANLATMRDGRIAELRTVDDVMQALRDR